MSAFLCVSFPWGWTETIWPVTGQTYDTRYIQGYILNNLQFFYIYKIKGKTHEQGISEVYLWETHAVFQFATFPCNVSTTFILLLWNRSASMCHEMYVQDRPTLGRDVDQLQTRRCISHVESSARRLWLFVVYARQAHHSLPLPFQPHRPLTAAKKVPEPRT